MRASSTYRASGDFSPLALPLVLTLALPAAACLAAIYAYAILYVRQAAYIAFFLAAALGVVTGLSTAWALRLGKVRNLAVSVVASALVAGGAFYVHWTTWTFAFLARAGVEVSWLELLASPAVLWERVVGINAQGAWTLAGVTPTGGWLWALWATEALLILTLAMLWPTQVPGEPFCERCQRWCEPESELHRWATSDDETVRTAALAKNFAALAARGAPPDGAREFLQLDLEHCGSCSQTNALTVKRVTLRTDQDGATSASSNIIVSYVLVSATELEAIRGLAVVHDPVTGAKQPPA